MIRLRYKVVILAPSGPLTMFYADKAIALAEYEKQVADARKVHDTAVFLLRDKKVLKQEEAVFIE